MKTVITYGTFDLLHRGHIRLLKKARSLGDRLIVALSTNEFNKIKKKECVYSFNHRKEILEAIKYVDFVISEKSWEQKEMDIKKYDISIFVMGSDWIGEFDYLEEYCTIAYVPRTKGISTTQVKEMLKK